MHIWRRSYDVAPPGGESLKDTAARVLPYYIEEILPRVLRCESVVVAAHGNSLRALVMVLDRLSAKEIAAHEIATGVPLIYRLNANSTVAEKQIWRGDAPSPRVREKVGWGPVRWARRCVNATLTRIALQSDLSPRGGERVNFTPPPTSTGSFHSPPPPFRVRAI